MLEHQTITDISQIRNEGGNGVVVPGNLDWEYPLYSLPPDSHYWSEEHNSLFGTDILMILERDMDD
jgi:hypothetical protein